ncbi:hypothetical protein FRC17_000910 [Serendipita sp. 399]|nr:hypothetical protein FRC17_000910 [Serendipita sp. 399]
MLDQLGTYDKWVVGVIGCSILSCILQIGFSFGDGAYGRYSYWTAPAAALLTIGFHAYSLPLWLRSEKKRRVDGTQLTTLSFIYSKRSCVQCFLLAFFWLAVFCSTFTFVPVSAVVEPKGNYVVAWIEASFTAVNQGLMWAEFGLIVHHRRHFFKPSEQAKEKAQLSAAQLAAIREKPVVLTTTKLERHTKWILAWILASLSLSIAELGIAFGGGAKGSYSLYMGPPAAGMTILLNVITLVLWRYTAKKRSGTTKPSFLYSATLCTLTGLLAIYWLAPVITTFLFLSFEADSDMRPFYYYDNRKYVLPWIEAFLSLVMSVVLWVEFFLLVIHRAQFLQQIRFARYAGRIQGTTVIVPPEQGV